jgi:hypothetical protein
VWSTWMILLVLGERLPQSRPPQTQLNGLRRAATTATPPA